MNDIVSVCDYEFLLVKIKLNAFSSVGENLPELNVKYND